jgi:3-oxoacyl-[acyl-carrier-protein] synthase II
VNLRRAVITGMGVLAPNGGDLESFWSSLVAGRSAAGPITRFDASDLPSRIACEINNVSVGRVVDPKRAKRFGRAIQYSLVASHQAVADAGLDWSRIDLERAASIEGASLGGLESSFKAQAAYENKGHRSMSPFTLLNAHAGGGSAEVAIEFGLRGAALTLGSGSCASTDALALARSMIVNDEADVILAGGSEAPLLGPVLGAFCLAEAASTRNDDPAGAMRPFDAQRDGFVLGEGAAWLVIEELGHALQRGARIRAELAGAGRCCEASHSVTPEADGRGVTTAISKALRQAGMDPADAQYLNLHGLASDAADPAESAGIARVFAGRLDRLSTSATKPVTGYLLGAAGALEAVITTLALERQLIPPTINFKTAAPGCELDYTPGEARPYPLTGALSLNAGFGGRNSCLAFRRWQP